MKSLLPRSLLPRRMVLLGLGIALTGNAQPPAYFAAAPAHSLIRKLAGRLEETPPTTGIVTRQCRWLANRKLLRLESALPGKAKEGPVVELMFRLRALYQEADYTPRSYRGDSEWYGSTFWTGPDWPRAGRVSVRGRVFKLHLAGDGIRASIRLGEREVWQAEIDGQDDPGVEPNLTLEVQPGEPLRFVVHHIYEIKNLWAMRPDGSNPVAVWGNATPKPNCSFQAKPIPGSRKIVFIASAHHAITGGPVCLLDRAVDPNSLEAITRLTPGPFPEAESGKWRTKTSQAGCRSATRQPKAKFWQC